MIPRADLVSAPATTRPATRCLLIGAGGWGSVWGRTLLASEGVELIGIVDPSTTALERMSREFAMQPAACFQSLASALKLISCDAAIVATPMWSHHEIVTLCLEAGKHVLCEKPLATSMADAVSLDRAATRAGHVLMVGQSYRYRRPARAVRRVLSDGTLGTLLSIRIVTRRDTSTFWEPNDTRYAIPHFYLLDNGVHHLDALRAVTGSNVAIVYSRGWPTPGSPYTHNAGGVALLDLDGGASVLYDNEYAAKGRETSWNGEWDITGTEGRLFWRGGNPDADSAEITLHLSGQALTPVQLPERTGSELDTELAEFISAIETGETPETSSADNLQTMAAVFGCVQSVETHQVVSIPDLMQEADCGT